MNNLEINPRGTVIARAVTLSRLYRSFGFRVLTFFFWILGLVSIVGIISNPLLSTKQDNLFLGLEVIGVGLFMFYLAYRSFYFSKEIRPHSMTLVEVQEKIKSGTKVNLFELFSMDLASVLKPAFEAREKDAISNKSILTTILSSHDIYFVLGRLGIHGDELFEFIEEDRLDDKAIVELLLVGLEVGAAMSHDQIEVGDLFAALCKKSAGISKVLNSLKITHDDILNVIYWQTKVKKSVEAEKGLFNTNKLRMTGGVGRDWAYGWTPFLKQFSQDISKSIRERGLGLEIIGHDSEIKQIEEALLRQSGGNVIIVGETGVGKDTTVLGFAKKVIEGETHTELDFQQIVKIDTNFLLAGVTNGGEVTDRINGLLSEASAAGNIIIYFENFQNLISGGDAGKVDATEVLLPFLEHSGVHIIATCDVASFNQYISTNSALNSRLTRISIDEPDKAEMIRIIEDVVPMIEYRTKSIISYEAIKEAIVAADKYIMNLPNPEKSINLLDGATAKAVSERGKTIILPKDIDLYIGEKYEVPTGDVDETEKDKLLSLEAEMHKSVIGQTEAISAISNAMRRTRAGIVDSKKPIGSFLFLGPTGVGKTETAKALARSYFGDESKMIRFDMSEYQNKEDIYRLIGSNLGGGDELGLLTTAVREKPFSLILFDEIEKAYPDILNLFLQMLDEGFLTDGAGRKVSFTNTIIIFTSNAGANLIRESIQGGAQYDTVKASLLNYLQKENIFRPEFINRFSAVIAFAPLSLPEIKEVAGLMITKMVTTIKENKGVDVVVSPPAIEKLASLGFDPQMGARPMARVIEEKLENLLATKILSGELKNGDSTTISENEII